MSTKMPPAPRFVLMVENGKAYSSDNPGIILEYEAGKVYQLDPSTADSFIRRGLAVGGRVIETTVSDSNGTTSVDFRFLADDEPDPEPEQDPEPDAPSEQPPEPVPPPAPQEVAPAKGEPVVVTAPIVAHPPAPPGTLPPAAQAEVQPVKAASEQPPTRKQQRGKFTAATTEPKR